MPSWWCRKRKMENGCHRASPMVSHFFLLRNHSCVRRMRFETLSVIIVNHYKPKPWMLLVRSKVLYSSILDHWCIQAFLLPLFQLCHFRWFLQSSEKTPAIQFPLASFFSCKWEPIVAFACALSFGEDSSFVLCTGFTISPLRFLHPVDLVSLVSRYSFSMGLQVPAGNSISLSRWVANALRKLSNHQLCSPTSLPTEWTQSGTLFSESSSRFSFPFPFLPTVSDVQYHPCAHASLTRLVQKTEGTASHPLNAQHILNTILLTVDLPAEQFLFFVGHRRS